MLLVLTLHFFRELCGKIENLFVVLCSVGYPVVYKFITFKSHLILKILYLTVMLYFL
jgi:hypothetical protein